MYSSNQVLKISGDEFEQLEKSLEFVIAYDEKKVESMYGCKQYDNKIVFGWIPRIDTCDKNSPFKSNYVKEWDFVFPMEPTIAILVETIKQFLDKFDYEAFKGTRCADETYHYGWILTGFDSYNTPDVPTFSIFSVEPFITEYDD